MNQNDTESHLMEVHQILKNLCCLLVFRGFFQMKNQDFILEISKIMEGLANLQGKSLQISG